MGLYLGKQFITDGARIKDLDDERDGYCVLG